MKKVILTIVCMIVLLAAVVVGFYSQLTSKDFRLVVMTETPDVVALRIRLGADVNALDEHGWSPLAYAFSADDDVAKSLLAEDPKIDRSSIEKKRISDVAVVALLVDAGADVNWKNASNESVLILATRQNKTEVVKALLKAGADVTVKDEDQNTALIHAVHSNLEISRALIASGADVNATNADNETPLLLACEAGKLELVNTLLEAGARMDVKNLNGQTPVHKALASTAKIEILRALFADPDKTPAKPTGVHLAKALDMGEYDLARLLIACGADVNYKTEELVPLITLLADDDTNLGIVAALIEAGTDVNVEDADGVTPLIQSILSKKPRCTSLLLAAGADPNKAHKSFGTALHVAVEMGNLELTKALLMKGAKVNAVDDAGKTPLHRAAVVSLNAKPSAAMLELLLDNGAKLDAKDKDGKTALDHARDNGVELSAAILKKAAIKSAH